MRLDLSAPHKALAQLEEALAFCRSELAKKDERLALHLRAAAIQAFEFTYEIAVKTLKRFLEATEADPSAVDAMTFNEMIRLGYERGLLQAELAAWKEFRRDRGTTSHTYDESKAQDVFESIPAFIEEVRFLLTRIEERQEKAL